MIREYCPACGALWEPCPLCRGQYVHQQCVPDEMCHQCVMRRNVDTPAALEEAHGNE